MTEFKDPRDGNIYKTVKLRDGKVWFAQGLAYEINGALKPNGKDSDAGYLYNWDMLSRAIPAGWRLPTRSEWEYLSKLYGDAMSQELSVVSGGFSHGGDTHPGNWQDAFFWVKEKRFWIPNKDKLAKDSEYIASFNVSGGGFLVFRDFKRFYYGVRCVKK